ncbi:GAF domain-containing protein [Cryptosporangium aurantiacum]|uniref:GAF domain-containing protein n=1 Tax=Cryptosporangium aurantiacum TaxID=134849 RepID=A0A1M7RED8_9ACTN|nr:GAF domain-containing protein [Cryptosporangium aurantiacum]SHN44509.1 GAF domain-containing protein [Cryptosporangium aurantiacum]
MSTLLHHRLADKERLAALACYDVDDAHLKQQLDAIAMRTAAHLHMPTAMTTLMLDNAMLIAGSHGVDGWLRGGPGGPAEWAFCAQTVLTREPYIVSDAITDPVQCTNPVVELDGIRAYAGAPLITPSGQVLGAHCVIDVEPHLFSDEEIAELRAAAEDVVTAFEQHPSRNSPDYMPTFFTNG